MGQVVSRDDIRELASGLLSSGKKIVFTNGCFDLIHVGHTRYLTEAAKLGDVLVVGLNSDDSVKKIKGGGRPLIPESERAEVLASLSCVDYVVVFDEDRPDELIREIRPDYHVKGGDYSMEEIPEKDLVESLGGKVVLIPEIEGRSTSKIIEKIGKAYGQKKRA